jgi:hypothetical protein
MRRMLPLIAAASLVSATALAESGKGSATSPAGGGDSNNALIAPPGDNTSGQGAWSEERMRNAKPKPLPRVDPGRGRDQPK